MSEQILVSELTKINIRQAYLYLHDACLDCKLDQNQLTEDIQHVFSLVHQIDSQLNSSEVLPAFLQEQAS